MTRSQMIEIPADTYARSKVYDLRQYTDGSFWGPFKNDGSQDVDWEKAEAIMVVLGYNLRTFNERPCTNAPPVWEAQWRGCTANSFVDQATRLTTELGQPGGLNDQDPYGISGMWMRASMIPYWYCDMYADIKAGGMLSR